MPSCSTTKKKLWQHQFVFLFIAFKAICCISKPTCAIVYMTLNLLDPSWGCLEFDHGHQWLTSMTNSTSTNNLPLCHWWQYSYSFSFSPCHHAAPPIMMLVIDRNSHTLSLAPPVIMVLPLSWCSSIFISCFDINGKGNASWCSHVCPFGV